MNGNINGYCPIDGEECVDCFYCAVLDNTSPWPKNWLNEIKGKWPGNETIEELLDALKNKGVNPPPTAAKEE